MKKTNIIVLSSLMLLSSSSIFAQQSEKTLIKSFNLNGNNLVIFDIDAPVELIEWSSDIMRINMTVGLENGTEAMLKSLVQVGRYNLKSNENAEGLVVNAPGLQRKVTVRGTELKENISLVIYKPENVEVRFKNEASTSKEDVKKPSML